MTRKLGDILISQGVIDEEKLVAALSDQRAFGGKLGRTLVDLGYVNEDQLVHGLAQQLGLETVDLDTVEIEVEALSCLPVDACERYGVFPIRMDRKERLLWVATAEPDRATLQEVAQIAQLTLEPVLASMSSIDRAVRQYYFGDKLKGPKPRLGEPLLSIPGDPAAAAAAARSGAAAAASDEHLPDAQVEPSEQLPLGAHVSPDAEHQHDSISELKNLILRLEKTMTAQGRAFRALVELLQDKGVVRRGELGLRASREKKP